MDLADEMQELIDAHNSYRAGHRRQLPPMTRNEQLMDAAQQHAEFMARTRRMSHVGEGRSRFTTRIKQAGYDMRRAAENVAAGQQTVTAVMSAWQRSRGHNANILGDYREIGVGRAGNYWCVVFAS